MILNGAFYYNDNCYATIPTYDVHTIDTTGAGDAFLGAVLNRVCGLSRDELRQLDEWQLRDILSFANACGSLTTTKKGAIPALPSLAEIEMCLKSIPAL